MTKSTLFIVLVGVTLMVSCSSNPKENEESRGDKDSTSSGLFSTEKAPTGRTALAVPPDLLGSASEKVRKNQEGVVVSGEEVLPEIVGATIQSDEGRSWLKIDADAEVVWHKLTEFWAFQEIELVDYQPKSGVMATDWFAKARKAPAASGFGSIAVELLGAITNRRTALDKFTIRLERNDAGGTNLYVTHRSREKISKQPANKYESVIFEWVEREQDAEKIAQLLQAIVLLFNTESEETEDPA